MKTAKRRMLVSVAVTVLILALLGSCGIKKNDYVGGEGDIKYDTVFPEEDAADAEKPSETTAAQPPVYSKYFAVVAGETSDGVLYIPYKDENGVETDDIMIVGYSGPSLNVKIPSIIEGGNVVAIGEGAFYGKGNIMSVTVPDSVVLIEKLAFSTCPNLTSVVIGNGVTEIPYGAFYGCRVLNGVTLPEGLISIGDSAFEGCYRLESLYIPSGVTHIGQDAFMTCERLTLDVSDNAYAADYAQDNLVNTDSGMSYSARRLRVVLCIAGAAVVSAVIIVVPILIKRRKRDNISYDMT